MCLLLLHQCLANVDVLLLQSYFCFRLTFESVFTFASSLLLQLCLLLLQAYIGNGTLLAQSSANSLKTTLASVAETSYHKPGWGESEQEAFAEKSKATTTEETSKSAKAIAYAKGNFKAFQIGNDR